MGLVACLAFSATSCKRTEELCSDVDKLPDLEIPQFMPINVLTPDGSTLLIGEKRPCFINLGFYPNGAPVSVFGGSVNEFYSLERFDFVNGWPLVFYWTNLAPFDPTHSNPVMHPPQIGDSIRVHKFITNVNVGGALCSILNAGESLTKSRMKFKVLNGEIVEVENATLTPSIIPGALVPVTMKFPFKGYGNYTFEFEVNFDRRVEERDTTNNFVSVQVKDMGIK